MVKVFATLVLVLPLLLGCSKTFYPASVTTTYYSISDSSATDQAIVDFIQPYKDSLAKEMDEVIAQSSGILPKAQPESLLGNLIADLLLEQGQRYCNCSVDVAVMNYGGLRVPALPEGNITKGQVFELMPFDNFLVILKVKGNIIDSLLGNIAGRGGWPISGGRFQIKDGKAAGITIGGGSLDPAKYYHVAISDYLADGGDNLVFLKEQERINLGVFIRDLIIEDFSARASRGEKISATLDRRISINE